LIEVLGSASVVKNGTSSAMAYLPGKHKKAVRSIRYLLIDLDLG
jgi:hypothetical protein